MPQLHERLRQAAACGERAAAAADGEAVYALQAAAAVGRAADDARVAASEDATVALQLLLVRRPSSLVDFETASTASGRPLR